MATFFADVPVFQGISVTSTTTDENAFIGMSAIGQVGNWWEGWSISNLTAATAQNSVDASTTVVTGALATLIAQLARLGIVRASGTGF